MVLEKYLSASHWYDSKDVNPFPPYPAQQDSGCSCCGLLLSELVCGTIFCHCQFALAFLRSIACDIANGSR